MLKDGDNAFKQGYFVVTNETGEEVLKESICANTELAYALRMTEGISYRFNLVITYDLSHGLIDSEEMSVIDETVFDKTITFTRDFDFIPSDVSLTQKVSSDDNLVLTFKNGYDSYYNVRTVVIDETEYPVNGHDENGVYSVVILKPETKGEHTVQIISVTLENDTATYYSFDKTLNICI